MNDIDQLLIKATGGGFLAILAAYGIKIAIDVFLRSRKNVVDGGAENSVVTVLRSQIEALGRDIQEIKREYRAEKVDLENQIDELRTRLNRMTFRIGHLRTGLIDIYATLSQKCAASSCPEWEKLHEQVKRLIEEEF